MARIRSIKPEFFYSEQVTSVSMAARMFFIGLWTIADREGRLQWAPRKLKAQIFPYDDVQIFELAEELTAAGLLHIYEVSQAAYAWIPGFTKHQRPHPKEAKSEVPECPPDHDAMALPWNRGTSKAVESREKVVMHPVVSHGEGKGREGDLGVGVSDPPLQPPQPVEWPKPPRVTDSHRSHVNGFCDWVCLPEFLFNEFVNKCPSGIGTVDTWAKQVRRQWQEQEITDDNLTFWRARWMERPKPRPVDDVDVRGEAAMAAINERIAKYGGAAQ